MRNKFSRLARPASRIALFVCVLWLFWKWWTFPPPRITLDILTTRIDFTLDSRNIDPLLRTFDATKLTFLSPNKVDFDAGRFVLPSGSSIDSTGKIESEDELFIAGAALDGVTTSSPDPSSASILWDQEEPDQLHVTIAGIESVTLQPTPELTLNCNACSGFKQPVKGVKFRSSGPLGHETRIFPARQVLSLAVAPDPSFKIEGLPVSTLSFQKTLDGRLHSTVQGGTVHFADLSEADAIKIHSSEVIQVENLSGFQFNHIQLGRDDDKKPAGLQIEATGVVGQLTASGRDILPSVLRRMLNGVSNIAALLLSATFAIIDLLLKLESRGRDGPRP
jgi:hypothetical protein